LTKVYFEGKDVECVVENDADVKIPVDENKFTAVIINLVKNASEAFNQESYVDSSGKNDNSPQNGNNSDVRDGKYIKIKTEEDGDFAVIRVSNNAGKIENPENIFQTGYTTKTAGSGLGLMICKKSIEEMFGRLELEINTDEKVEFVIKIGKVG